MFWMILLLVSGLLILLILFIRLKRDINYITKQLKKNQATYTSIRIKSMDKHVEQLANEINCLYDYAQQERVTLKKKEEYLRQSITHISHDLRTPLTSIKGYMQLMERDSNKEEKKQYIEIIKKRTEHLQELVTTFYDLSRIEEQEYPFEYSMVHLGECLAQSILMYYEDFTSRGIEPSIEIEEDIPMIVADKQVVQRIFSNLISNIVKYGASPVSISLKQQDGVIVTTFCNYAPELKGEQVSSLFERFYSGDHTRGNRSSGLGLSIAKEFVEQLGHNIHATLENKMLCIQIQWHLKQ